MSRQINQSWFYHHFGHVQWTPSVAEKPPASNDGLTLCPEGTKFLTKVSQVKKEQMCSSMFNLWPASLSSHVEWWAFHWEGSNLISWS
jgi:hypothetical protein